VCASRIIACDATNVGEKRYAGARLPIDTDADVRARKVVQQMADEERFSLLVSVMGSNDLLPVRDVPTPPDVPGSGSGAGE
jgi:hypothetical protein